ncbi:MAG TPA: gliding motility-associated ABC transporter substrate-binding protein GldG [Chitinophagaceae bacterium]|nr:gliding motility-associated ABC transporter substrate-binding protein GldG [Chitinophagaceae bacterium]
MTSKGSRNKYLTNLLLVAGLLLINLVASFIYFRVDLTEEKRYTITRSTKQLINDLGDDLTVTVFLKGDYPPEFRRLSNTTADFLRVLKASNPAQLSYRFVDPLDEVVPGKRWSDSLQAMGIHPINLSVQVKSGQENKLAFPYALVQYNGDASFVNLFQSSRRSISAAEMNNAEAVMEYQFAKAIHKLANPQKPFIAYATGHGEPMGPEILSLQAAIDPETAQQNERSDYKMFLFNLKTQPVIPDTMKALLIVKPATPFSADEKLKIDQYLMRGGKLIWFVDNLFAEQDSLSIKSQLIAYERDLGIQDQLFRYGVRINADLIMDLQCDFLPFAVGGSPGEPQYEFLRWNYYPLFESRNNHPINKNIGLVAGRFVNSLDTIESPRVRKTFLLQSSSNARTITTPALISPNENRNAPEDALFNQKNIPAAVILEGEFTSFFKNRLGRAQMDSLQPYGGFRESSSNEAKLIVVADGDVVMNDVSAKQGPLPMGMNLFTLGSQYEYQFANREFLLNCLEYVTSGSNIIEARNKEVVLRLLDQRKVEEQRTKWQLINIALPVLLVVLFGIIYQQLRKRKYAFEGT